MNDWKSQADELLHKGFIDSDIYDRIMGIPINDHNFYGKQNEAREYLLATSPNLAYHPIGTLVISGLAFSNILANCHYFAESQQLTENMYAYIKWAKDSFADEESPFPFENVQKSIAKKIGNKKQAALLGKFLDSFDDRGS